MSFAAPWEPRRWMQGRYKKIVKEESESSGHLHEISVQSRACLCVHLRSAGGKSLRIMMQEILNRMMQEKALFNTFPELEYNDARNIEQNDARKSAFQHISRIRVIDVCFTNLGAQIEQWRRSFPAQEKARRNLHEWL